MKTILFALVATGLLVFTGYRAMTFEPDGYGMIAPAVEASLGAPDFRVEHRRLIGSCPHAQRTRCNGLNLEAADPDDARELALIPQT